MKVALVSRAVLPWHGYGGLERHVAALKKYLDRAGCEVTLYTSPPREAGPPADGVVFVPYRIVPWPRARGFVIADRNTNYPAWSLRAGRRLLAAKPDVVQADGGAGFGYAWLRRGREGDTPPLVLHPHGMEEFKAPFAKHALYLPLRSAVRAAARGANRVIAPDASMKEEVERFLGIDTERIAVVPNAVDLEEIDRKKASVAPERFGIERDGLLFLSVGRLEANKGFSDLIRALGEVRDRLPERFLWLLVGEGPERARLEKELSRCGVARHARLAGALGEDALSALYERADLVVLPTLYEGSSMVTLEAMAHGKPVLATRVGGIPDKIVHGESGLLVPPGDPAALAGALVEALGAGEALAGWGRQGRRTVEAKFAWSKRVLEVIALYEDVLRLRSRGRA